MEESNTLFHLLTAYVRYNIDNVSNTLFHLLDCLYWCMYNVPYRNCTYNRLPEEELSGSKHVEDIKKTKD